MAFSVVGVKGGNDGTALSATDVTGFISFTSPLASQSIVGSFILLNNQNEDGLRYLGAQECHNGRRRRRPTSVLLYQTGNKPATAAAKGLAELEKKKENNNNKKIIIIKSSN